MEKLTLRAPKSRQHKSKRCQQLCETKGVRWDSSDENGVNETPKKIKLRLAFDSLGNKGIITYKIKDLLSTHRYAILNLRNNDAA